MRRWSTNCIGGVLVELGDEEDRGRGGGGGVMGGDAAASRMGEALGPQTAKRLRVFDEEGGGGHGLPW